MKEIKDESLLRKVDKAILNSVSYDEMKFLDDWVAYIKERDIGTTYNDPTDKESNTVSSDFSLEESSSFESVMNFYMESDSKLTNSEGIDFLDLYVNSSSVDHDFSSIDLIDNANLVDSAIINRINEEALNMENSKEVIKVLKLNNKKIENHEEVNHYTR